MKRFLFTAQVKKAEGSQTFYVDAENYDEAVGKINCGGGEIYNHEVEVVSLDDFEFERETSLDDFGDFPPVKEQPHD